MRTLRLFAYFLIGVLLSVSTVLAYAETIAATYIPPGADTVEPTKAYESYGVRYATFNCTAIVTDWPAGSCGSLEPTYAVEGYCGRFFNNSYCSNKAVQAVRTCATGYSLVNNMCVNQVAQYKCPAGQNWTLSGQTCTRPTCVAPQVMQADGTCLETCPIYGVVAPDSQGATKPASCSCPAGTAWSAYDGCRKTCTGPWGAGQVANGGFDLILGKGETEGCTSGCGFQHRAGPFDVYANGSRAAPGTYTGWSCAGNGVGTAPAAEPAPNTPAVNPADKKPPVCGPGEGVITSSSGNVLCLPPGTPATTQPKVEKEKKVETYPDGTQKTTEQTKTTDPNTGATHTGTTSTSTGKTDGTAGQAGPVGTVTSNGTGGAVDGNGDGSPDEDGDCDPREKMCSKPELGKLYEKKEKTIEGVLGKFTMDMKATPIGEAIETTLDITVPGGSCPALSVNIAYLNTTIDLAPYICNPTAIQYLETMGDILKIVVGYIALTWVFL